MTKLFVHGFLLMIWNAGLSQSATVAQPLVWLKANEKVKDGNMMADVSGHKRDALFYSSAAKPGGGLLNFNDVIYFDGGSSRLDVPFDVRKLPAYTIVTVYKSSDTLERNIWGTGNPVNSRFLTTRSVSGADNKTRNYGRYENKAVINVITQQAKIAATDEEVLTLGNTVKQTGRRPFRGYFAEYLVFDRVLSFMERRKIETYLAVKYGITTGGNYISSAGKVLWSKDGNKNYSHRIFGLGRDDAFRLYQKQSKSAEDSAEFIVLSAGVFRESNPENASAFNNGNYILCGDDDGLLAFEAGNKNGKPVLLRRKWYVKVSGETAFNIATEVRVNTSKLARPAADYVLLIDRSGAGNFPEDQTETVYPSGMADGMTVFSNISWDTDRSGADVYTLAMTGSKEIIRETKSEPVSFRKFDVTPNIISQGESYTVGLVLENKARAVIKVYDARGALVSQKPVSTDGNYRFTAPENAGVYLISLEAAGQKADVRKLVVQ